MNNHKCHCTACKCPNLIDNDHSICYRCESNTHNIDNNAISTAKSSVLQSKIHPETWKPLYMSKAQGLEMAQRLAFKLTANHPEWIKDTNGKVIGAITMVIAYEDHVELAGELLDKTPIRSAWLFTEYYEQR